MSKLHPIGLLPVITGEDIQEEPNWQERARCAETDPDAFFPEKGGSTREAKKICLGCDVRDECLEYALQHDERHGIWGGLSDRERRKLKTRTDSPNFDGANATEEDVVIDVVTAA
jgi:WhiB family transcriptional regulator, redox-sensing transcriptional regulator